MEQTAVEWLEERFEKFLAYYEGHRKSEMYSIHQLSNDFDQAKEMEKQRMIDLVQQLKDYTRESNNVLGFDEREASEFVEIFYNETFKSK